jgi:predicted methyltransferase/S-adenosylmethionine/arginine decarboxylase-like enzyme
VGSNPAPSATNSFHWYNTRVEDLIYRIKTQNSDLKEAEISGILHILKGSPKTSITELIRLTGLPKETVIRFMQSVSNIVGTQILTEIKTEPYKWCLLPAEQNIAELTKAFNLAISKANLKAKRNYDQFFATPETSIQKALMIKDKGMLVGKRIAILGDDDLVSIALSIIGGFTNLTVFEIDDDILTAIKVISEVMGIKNIHTVHYDAREKIKPEYLAKYDVVVTDPPYTSNGVSLFVNRAVQLLGGDKDSAGKYLFLYYGNSFKSPEKTLKVQEILGRYNLLIEDKIDKLARYHGAESIGSSSSLYILKSTPFTKALDEQSLSQPIYTFENQKEEKFPFVSHFVFKVFGVSKNVISSKVSMLKFLGRFCEAHKLKVIDQKTTVFKGQGFSFTFILGNSNLLVHTWPEHEALHIDLVTCSPIYRKEFMGKSLVDLFGASGVDVKEVE